MNKINGLGLGRGRIKNKNLKLVLNSFTIVKPVPNGIGLNRSQVQNQIIMKYQIRIENRNCKCRSQFWMIHMYIYELKKSQSRQKKVVQDKAFLLVIRLHIAVTTDKSFSMVGDHFCFKDQHLSTLLCLLGRVKLIWQKLMLNCQYKKLNTFNVDN